MSFWTDPLRMMLIVAGLIVVLGITLFGLRPKRREAVVDIPDTGKRESPLAPIEDLAEDAEEFTVTVKPARPRAEYEEQTRRAEIVEREVESVRVPDARAPRAANEQFMVLHVVAPEGGAFPGSDLRRAVESAGMAFGERKIFHFPAHRPRGTAPDFSLANMVEPGYFDMGKLEEFSTSGVTLFMRLPGNRDGLSMFTHMLATAQILSRKLGGILWDETRQPLTPERIGELRSDAATFAAESAEKDLQPA